MIARSNVIHNWFNLHKVLNVEWRAITQYGNDDGHIKSEKEICMLFKPQGQANVRNN